MSSVGGSRTSMRSALALRLLSLALALGLPAVTSSVRAQGILLLVEKGSSDPIRDVHLGWTALPGQAYEVFRGSLPDGSDRNSLIWLCGDEHVDSGAVSPPSGVFYYQVDPYTGPGALRADAGPDVGPGRAIGGSPAASGGRPPYTYSWTPPGDLTDASSPNPIATPSADTVYVLTVIDMDGCSASDSVDVLVPASPLVADAGPDPPAAVPCGYAARIRLGATPAATGGVAPYLFTWTPTLGLVDVAGRPEWDRSDPWLVPIDDVTYTMTATDRISDQAADQVSVTVDKSLTHCPGFGNYASPAGWCAANVSLLDQDCNPFDLHALRCNVVVVQFGEFT